MRSEELKTRSNRIRELINPWREIALIAVILMELSWILPWFQSLTWITTTYSPMLAFLVLGGAFFGAALFSRLVNALRLKLKIRQLVMAGFIVLSILVTNGVLASGDLGDGSLALVKAPLNQATRLDLWMAGNLVLSITTALIVWRGMVLAREYAGPVSVFESMQVGILVLCIYSILIARLMHTDPAGYVVLFLTSSLLAMVSSRIAILSRLRGGGRHAFDRKWLLGILIAITTILFTALAFAGLMIGQMERLRRVLQSMFVALMAIIAAPFLFLLSLLGSNFEPVVFEMPTPTPEGEINLAPNEELIEQIQEGQDPSFLAILLPYIKLILILGVVLLVVFLLARQFKSWADDIQGDEDTERQSMLDRDGLLKLLKKNLLKIKNNLGSLADLRLLPIKDRRKAAERIRQIYGGLIEMSASLGKPRPAADTPLEYLEVLKELFAGSEQDLETITLAYLRVRYGELPETQAEVEPVESAWRRIEDLAKELLKEQRAGHQKPVPV